MSLQKQATVFLAVLVGALLVGSGAVAIIQRQSNDARGRAQAAQLFETYEKQFAIGLLNQETAGRGYELTGQTQYLDPYRLGSLQPTTPRQFLDTASADSPTRSKLTAMEAAAGKWQAFATTRLVAVAGSGPSNDSSSDQNGKALFDAFRLAESN